MRTQKSGKSAIALARKEPYKSELSRRSEEPRSKLRDILEYDFTKRRKAEASFGVSAPKGMKVVSESSSGYDGRSLSQNEACDVVLRSPSFEPLSLRLFWRSGPRVPLLAGPGRAISLTDLRPASTGSISMSRLRLSNTVNSRATSPPNHPPQSANARKPASRPAKKTNFNARMGHSQIKKYCAHIPPKLQAEPFPG